MLGLKLTGLSDRAATFWLRREHIKCTAACMKVKEFMSVKRGSSNSKRSAESQMVLEVLENNSSQQGVYPTKTTFCESLLPEPTLSLTSIL